MVRVEGVGPPISCFQGKYVDRFGFRLQTLLDILASREPPPQRYPAGLTERAKARLTTRDAEALQGGQACVHPCSAAVGQTFQLSAGESEVSPQRQAQCQPTGEGVEGTHPLHVQLPGFSQDFNFKAQIQWVDYAGSANLFEVGAKFKLTTRTQKILKSLLWELHSGNLPEMERKPGVQSTRRFTRR